MSHVFENGPFTSYATQGKLPLTDNSAFIKFEKYLRSTKYALVDNISPGTFLSICPNFRSLSPPTPPPPN